MFLAIVLVCSTPFDVTECIPLPNIRQFFETREECEIAANDFGRQVKDETNFYAAAFCYETDYLEEV